MAIVTMEPWHLLSVVMQMRDEDALEFDLLLDDKDRQLWACQRALAQGLAFAVLNSDGLPLACFGFVDEAEGRCTAWLIARLGWHCYVKSISKVFRLVVKESGYRRIQAFAKPERPGAGKLLQWLGFTRDGPLPKMCADGGQMDLYSYT